MTEILIVRYRRRSLTVAVAIAWSWAVVGGSRDKTDKLKVQRWCWNWKLSDSPQGEWQTASRMWFHSINSDPFILSRFFERVICLGLDKYVPLRLDLGQVNTCFARKIHGSHKKVSAKGHRVNKLWLEANDKLGWTSLRLLTSSVLFDPCHKYCCWLFLYSQLSFCLNWLELISREFILINQANSPTKIDSRLVRFANDSRIRDMCKGIWYSVSHSLCQLTQMIHTLLRNHRLKWQTCVSGLEDLKTDLLSSAMQEKRSARASWVHSQNLSGNLAENITHLKMWLWNHNTMKFIQKWNKSSSTVHWRVTCQNSCFLWKTDYVLFLTDDVQSLTYLALRCWFPVNFLMNLSNLFFHRVIRVFDIRRTLSLKCWCHSVA